MQKKAEKSTAGIISASEYRLETATLKNPMRQQSIRQMIPMTIQFNNAFFDIQTTSNPKSAVTATGSNNTFDILGSNIMCFV